VRWIQTSTALFLRHFDRVLAHRAHTLIIHYWVHIPQQFSLFGPIWVTWMLPFERYFGEVMKLLRAKTDFVGGTMRAVQILERQANTLLDQVGEVYNLPQRYRSIVPCAALGAGTVLKVGPSSPLISALCCSAAQRRDIPIPASPEQVMQLDSLIVYKRVQLTNGRFCGSKAWDTAISGVAKRAVTSMVICEYQGNDELLQEWVAEVQLYCCFPSDPGTVMAAVKWLGVLRPLQRDHILNVIQTPASASWLNKVDVVLVSQIKRLICTVNNQKLGTRSAVNVVIEIPSFAEL